MYSSARVPIAAVERVWFGDSDVDPSIGHRSDPVLGADLVFTLTHGEARVALQGPLTRRHTYPHRPPARYVGIRFRPGFGALFEDVKLHAIQDGAYALDRLWRCALDDVGEQLAGKAPSVQLGMLVEMMRAADLPAAPPSAVARSLRHVEERGGRTTVAQVARAADVSMRQLQRLMTQHLGITAKTLIRLVRMREVAAQCRAGPVRLADLAVDLGFADQAHMSHEVRRILLTTPAALLRESRQPPRESLEVG